jgi:hypothetical protein
MAMQVGKVTYEVGGLDVTLRLRFRGSQPGLGFGYTTE